MTKYKHKPTEVEASQWDGTTGGGNAVAKELGIPGEIRGLYGGAEQNIASISIETRNGEVKVLPGDWIVKGPSGDIWPVNRTMFVAVYEKATKKATSKKETKKDE